jgi:peptide/nickel transport system permease protein
MPVVLTTDALIFLLIVITFTFGFYASRHEPLRAPWRSVVRSKTGITALVVLSAYFIIGLLDSLHYRPALEEPGVNNDTRYSNEILSFFDWIATPLRTGVEKTYSAPFATHLYARETIFLRDGTQVRVFPRLRYGGHHLDNPKVERGRDIMLTMLQAGMKATIICLALWTVITGWLAKRSKSAFTVQATAIIQGDTAVPWRVLLLVLGLMLFIAIMAAHLSLKYHILGTDKVGEDVFYQALKSIRTGLVIGTLTTLVMLPFAISLGIMAGYFRGWIDDVIQYIYTTLNSIPSVLLIAAAILMLHIYITNHAEEFNNIAQRADLRLLFLCLILGVTNWTGLCRLLRGETLKLREAEYIQVAVAFGVSHSKIIVHHILPNVMHIVLISVVLDFSGLVLAEAVLSYIEIGVDPSTHSWGNMINSARLEMAREPIVWWSLAAALSFMFVLVLFANLFSDVVRDALDPRLRESP